MGTSRDTISEWIHRGIKDKQKWMIVVCDTFSYDDYPVYAKTTDEFWLKYEKYNGNNMQRIMESYDLTKKINEQLDMERCHSKPSK